MWTSGGIGDEPGDGGVDEWRDGESGGTESRFDGALQTVTPDLTMAPFGTMMMPFRM